MTLPTLKRDKNSPLKGSIKQKLFFQIVAILLLSAALILFVNSRLLSQVYIWREKDNLQQAARSINEMDQTQETDFRDQLYSLATKYNIAVEIMDSAGRPLWATFYNPYSYSSGSPLFSDDFSNNLNITLPPWSGNRAATAPILKCAKGAAMIFSILYSASQRRMGKPLKYPPKKM